LIFDNSNVGRRRYNTDGTVATAGNDNGTYTFTYDDQGRVIGVDEPFGVDLTFGYDQYGNRNLVKDNLGGEEDSLYNASGQLLSRTLTQSGSTLRIDFTYDEFGRVSTEKRYSDAAGATLVAPRRSPSMPQGRRVQLELGSLQ
jgi:YD repeat-containing protein